MLEGRSRAGSLGGEPRLSTRLQGDSHSFPLRTLPVQRLWGERWTGSRALRRLAVQPEYFTLSIC